ncbi:MAG: hypothetical protein U9N40_00495 [Euryarchaeota archaeon]|nr:hypothetical protein [Euryarchaeota archaeon]
MTIKTTIKEPYKWKSNIIVTVNQDVKIIAVPVSEIRNHAMKNVDVLIAKIRLTG